MATTSIGADRQSDVLVQKYPDALFIRSDIGKQYFGDGGKTAVSYKTAIGATVVEGAGDLAFSDTTVLYLGDGKDVGITWNGTQVVLSGDWSLSGVDVQLSDTQKLNLGNGADASIQWTGSDMRLTTSSDLRIDLTNNLIVKQLPVTRPQVSDALYRSDVISPFGGGYLVFVSSG